MTAFCTLCINETASYPGLRGNPIAGLLVALLTGPSTAQAKIPLRSVTSGGRRGQLCDTRQIRYQGTQFSKLHYLGGVWPLARWTSSLLLQGPELMTFGILEAHLGYGSMSEKLAACAFTTKNSCRITIFESWAMLENQSFNDVVSGEGPLEANPPTFSRPPVRTPHLRKRAETGRVASRPQPLRA